MNSGIPPHETSTSEGCLTKQQLLEVNRVAKESGVTLTADMVLRLLREPVVQVQPQSLPKVSVLPYSQIEHPALELMPHSEGSCDHEWIARKKCRTNHIEMTGEEKPKHACFIDSGHEADGIDHQCICGAVRKLKDVVRVDATRRMKGRKSKKRANHMDVICPKADCETRLTWVPAAISHYKSTHKYSKEEAVKAVEALRTGVVPEEMMPNGIEDEVILSELERQGKYVPLERVANNTGLEPEITEKHLTGLFKQGKVRYGSRGWKAMQPSA